MSLSKPKTLQYTYSEKQKEQLVVDNYIFNKCQQRPNGFNF